MPMYCLLLRVFLLAASLSLSAVSEVIELFDADITVHNNGSMRVKEEITVQATGQQIRHGIVREFPTHYQDRWGNNYIVKFDLKEVLQDGKPVAYSTVYNNNGVYIYLGNKDRYLRPGQYTFTIVYETERQLGFFDEHDELYWNVTGNGWRLPIEDVKVRVSLPEGIDIAQIKIDAFTGFFGQQKKDYEGYVARNGTVHFTTTKKFKPYEGLTIVVGWPKGYINYPSAWQHIIWFMKDNLHILIFLIGLLLLLAILFHAYRKKRWLEGQKPIIPLFYPPKDMTAGMMSYFVKHGYSNDALAAEIVTMAVHKWLTIKYVSGYLYGGGYTLIRNEQPTIAAPVYKSLFNRLFKSSKEIKLDKEDAPTITACQKVLTSEYKKFDTLFDYNINALIMGVVITMTSLFAIILFTTSVEMVFLFMAIYAALLCGGYLLLKSYTQAGFDLKREIDGFKLFLTTTEQERMKIIGTPPTKTPELYETYLPYAMVLGVEEQWSRQFTAVFEKLMQEGKPYQPIWYIGPRGRLFSSREFSSNLVNSVSSAISSSGVRPGGISGFGGGGRSGGGGGGGGGGGW